MFGHGGSGNSYLFLLLTIYIYRMQFGTIYRKLHSIFIFSQFCSFKICIAPWTTVQWLPSELFDVNLNLEFQLKFLILAKCYPTTTAKPQTYGRE